MSNSALPAIAASATPSPLAGASSQPVEVDLTYQLANSVAKASAQRRLQFISTSNTLLIVTVTPVGGTPVTAPTTQCTTTTCTSSFTANPGPNTLTFTLGDGTYTGGSSTITNVLSTFSTTIIVQPGILNTLAFTANPVVNSATVTLAKPTVSAGKAASDLVTVVAKDADGGIIAGTTSYVDASGNPLSFLLSVVNSQAGGKGRITLLGPTRITAPGQALTYAQYDGNWLDRSTISIAVTGAVSGALTGAVLATVPTATLYSTGITAGGNPHGIGTGSDGNVWFTEFSGNRVGRITPAGNVTEFSTGILAANPVKIEPGPDGNLYLGYSTSTILQRLSLSGVPTTAATFSNTKLYGITIGSDGNLWIGETASNVIAKLSLTGAFTEYSTGITAGAAISNAVAGPDGNIWFTENSTNIIGRITSSGLVTQFSTGITAGAGLLGITAGPDGNLWFTENTGNRVGRITPSGAVTEYSTGITVGSQPRNIVVGSDGNMWFDEDTGGRLASVTTSGTIQEYSAGFGGGRTLDLTLGPDGNLWYSDFGDNKIGKFVF